LLPCAPAFLDRVGEAIGRYYNPQGPTNRSSWEHNLLRSVKNHAPGQLEGVREINQAFNQAYIEKINSVIQTIIDSVLATRKQWPKATPAAITNQRKAFLDSVGAAIGWEYNPQDHPYRST
jgi:hypothetical protein